MEEFKEALFTDYLGEISERESLDSNLKLVYDSLYRHKLISTFSTIVFSGMSGALYAPLLAYKLKKYICGVRKKGEKSHSIYTLEGRLGKDYIICDDFSSTFSTIDYIQKKIKKELTNESEAFNIKPTWEANLVGVILYGVGNDTEKVQELSNLKNCWVLWQDKLFTPKDLHND